MNKPRPLTQFEFIFSTQAHHKFTRHLVFWVFCFLFFVITFYIPAGVFPGYDTSLFSKNVAKLGLGTWLWWRCCNAVLHFMPLIAFAYFVIYVMRNFYHSDNNWSRWLLLFITGNVLLFGISMFFAYLVELNNHRVNSARKTFSFQLRFIYILKSALFNYPIIGGFVVAITMIKRNWQKQQEKAQITREKASAELQLLKAQIHPHFLFNTLNNIYYFTLTNPQKAPAMLIRLTSMLQYILNDCKQQFVPLANEFKLLADYIALEQVRYGDRLQIECAINGDIDDKLIPPLLLIPLIENSFKHGASQVLEHPWVNINISVERHLLFFFISNSRPEEAVAKSHNGHIGLANVKKRLQLLFPKSHELRIAETTKSYAVSLKLALNEPSGQEQNLEKISSTNTTPHYAFA